MEDALFALDPPSLFEEEGDDFGQPPGVDLMVRRGIVSVLPARTQPEGGEHATGAGLGRPVAPEDALLGGEVDHLPGVRAWNEASGVVEEQPGVEPVGGLLSLGGRHAQERPGRRGDFRGADLVGEVDPARLGKGVEFLHEFVQLAARDGQGALAAEVGDPSVVGPDAEAAGAVAGEHHAAGKEEVRFFQGHRLSFAVERPLEGEDVSAGLGGEAQARLPRGSGIPGAGFGDLLPGVGAPEEEMAGPADFLEEVFRLCRVDFKPVVIVPVGGFAGVPSFRHGAEEEIEDAAVRGVVRGFGFALTAPFRG